MPTLAGALALANDGDTIRIDPGTFAGGVTVAKSVQIVGAGSSRTFIRGGGPVLTIGVEFAATEPTVSIGGVTITGGLNTSIPDHAVTHGGGVLIPQAGSFPFHTGATVTISDSVVTGNTVASQQFLPSGFCGPIDCSFSGGGGIFNEGNLTLVDTLVTDNHSGPGAATVFANGGGIANSRRGVLTIRGGVISGNTADSAHDSGLGAGGAGIDSSGPMSISDSVVRDNTAAVDSVKASVDDHVAIGGGIWIEDGGVATISRTTVGGNTVDVSTSVGTAFAVAAAIDVDGSLTLDSSSVAHNAASASAPDVAGSGGAFDVDGSLTVTNSTIVANQGTSSSPGGTALAGGGGIANFSRTVIDHTVVAANRLTANGSTGESSGGGIWNGDPGDGRTPALAATDSTISGNAVSGTGVLVRGGGLFTVPGVSTFSLTRTLLVGNRPDQCFGC